jgi:hypothetical protein
MAKYIPARTSAAPAHCTGLSRSPRMKNPGITGIKRNFNRELEEAEKVREGGENITLYRSYSTYSTSR